MCVCVCVCVFARACVCVCVRGALQASGASKRSNTHTINGILSVCLTLFLCSCSYSILSYVYKTQKNACTLLHLQIDVLYYLMKYLFNISEYKAMLIKLLIYHRNIYFIHMCVCMYVCIYICMYIYIYK